MRRPRVSVAATLVSLLTPVLTLAVTSDAADAADAENTRAAAGAAAGGGAGVAVASASPLRWTDTTPDGMVEAIKARALAPKAPERDVLAAIAVLHELAPRASYGSAQRALEAIAAAESVDKEIRAEAALVARAVGSAPSSDAEAAKLHELGVVTELAILGPFRDTGGGLDRKEGPEARGGSFADRSTRYAWGAMDVAWRTLPRSYARAEGVPLDVFIHPRKESCTYVATRLDLTAAQPVVAHLASSGQARLSFDGVEIARSEDVNASALLDRLEGRVDAAAGSHLITAKICAGALTDDGRVRLRVTDANGASLAAATSAELRDVKSGNASATAKGKNGAPPAKVTKLSTPLGRALATSKDAPSADALLDAAIVRTLGGADDMKSPRASGILDAVTRRKDLDADRLAMAGWIAPSGANRSGWLNLARARAESAKDDRTLAFADRRLVAEHVNARMADWAMASLKGAKLDGAKDDEATLLEAIVLDRLGPEALRMRALDSLKRAADKAPTTVPTGLLVQLAATAAPLDPARALAAQEQIAQRGERGVALVDARMARGKKPVAEAAALVFDGSLGDADEALEIAKATARAGAHDVARELYARVVAWAPNRAEGWAGLAEELGATHTNASDAETSAAQMAALRRARELAPGDARYRAELALRQHGSGNGGGSEPASDERYLVPSQTVLSRRQGVPASGAPDVADRQLYWLRAVVMHPDKRVSQLIHYAREIVIAPRTTDELYEPLPAEGDLTEILRARVHRKDGGTAFPAEEHNEGDRPRIRWPELAPGDTVEVVIRTWTDRPVGGRGDAPFYFIDYAGSSTTHPLLYNEVVVESTPQQSFYVDVIHGAPDRREEKDENGKHITKLIWDKPVSVPDEPLAPAMSETIPVIAGSTFKSWADFRGWYGEAVRGFSDPDDEVRRLAAELTKGKTTREQKVNALFTFVADDIRYVNYVSGEWWLPNRPQQLLARREGDCDDKALLLISLLKACGIEAQEVLVQTRMTGEPTLLKAKNVAIPKFDHGIAFLPGPGGGTYLDATSPASRLGPLSSMDARAAALRMDGPAEIVDLPPSSPDDHGSDVDWTIALKSDGSADLVGEEKHSGDSAFFARSNMSEPGARLTYVEHYLVGGWFPTIEVDKNIEFKGELAQGKAWVKYKAHSDGLARHEDGDLVVPLARSSTLTSELAPLLKRTLPVSLPPYIAPSHETRATRFVAPAGYAWAELPPGGDEKGGPFGQAHLQITKDPKDPRAVLVKRTVTFDMDRIPVDKYGEWRGWLQRVDALMNKRLRLVAAGNGAAPGAGAEKAQGAK